MLRPMFGRKAAGVRRRLVGQRRPPLAAHLGLQHAATLVPPVLVAQEGRHLQQQLRLQVGPAGGALAGGLHGLGRLVGVCGSSRKELRAAQSLKVPLPLMPPPVRRRPALLAWRHLGLATMAALCANDHTVDGLTALFSSWPPCPPCQSRGDAVPCRSCAY